MTINVFVGCAPNGEDAESMMVLEYSLRKHTNRDVKIHWMRTDSSPVWSGWNTRTWATPFSGYRWSVPAAMNYEGKAIYMDSDMIILSDIGQLYDQSFKPGKVVLSKGGGEGWRFCVCLWDCAAASSHILPLERMKKIPESHQRMMAYFTAQSNVVQAFDGNWNCIDGEDLKIEDIDILHYSDMSTQMHAKYAIPRLEAQGRKHWFDGNLHEHWRKDLIELFDQYYNEALDAGYKVEDYDVNAGVEIVKESQANYDNYRNIWSK